MARLFYWLKGLWLRVFFLLFPMFARGRARAQQAARPRLRLALRVLVVALVLVALYFLNDWLELDKFVRAPFLILRRLWLPLLALLVYTLCWLGWSLWKLLGPEQETSEFPDIDAAWDEAVEALTEAGIGLADLPLFVVLGRPHGSEKALFNAGGRSLQVRQAPRRPDAPISISADRDGLYVLCPGASLLARHATLLGGDAPARRAPAAPPGLEPSPAAEAREMGSDAASSADAPAYSLFGGEAVGATETAATTVLVAEEDTDQPQGAPRSRSNLMRDVEEVERLTARLRYLGARIARDRRPYCPINGILLLIPFVSTDNDADAKETASVCHRDLTALREAAQVQCPIFALVCDLERAPGFAEFLEFFPEGGRRRFLGQQLPLIPDLDAPGKIRMVEKALQWVGNVLFPGLVYKLWTPETPETPEAGRANARLFRFLTALRERSRRVARILTRGVIVQAQGAAMLGGVAFAATGRDLTREQGFAHGIFRLMLENQNAVSWTPEALAVEADYRRWTTLGYLGLTLLVVAVAALAAVLWLRS